MKQLNAVQQMLADTDMLAYKLPVKHDETEFEVVICNGECAHQCSSDCRRDGCNCECGEWHEVIDGDRIGSDYADANATNNEVYPD